MLEFSRSLYLCNHLSESIHSWTKGTLPKPVLPYPTPPTPPLPHPCLTLPPPIAFNPTPYPTLPYPTPPHPYQFTLPPPLPYPTQPYPTLPSKNSNTYITKPAAVELCCHATALIAYAKTKTQISFVVTAKLISAFVFTNWVVQSLFLLNPKFQASRHLL